jgi:hypothetical protein
MNPTPRERIYRRIAAGAGTSSLASAALACSAPREE